jgi:hypothetical protein
MVGHTSLDEVIFLMQRHMMDIMTGITFSTDVTGLTTVVAGLHEGFESPSAVYIHRDARGECV